MDPAAPDWTSATGVRGEFQSLFWPTAALVDLDFDGRPDLVVGGFDSMLDIYRNLSRPGTAPFDAFGGPGGIPFTAADIIVIA